MPKTPATIDIKLGGKSDTDPSVYFGEFRSLCKAVAECLRRSEMIVTGTKGAIRYRIAKLSTGSAEITLEAVRTAKARGRDKRSQVVGFFRRTTAAIQAGKKVDNRLGIDDLRAFRKLAPRRRDVTINHTTLTSAFEQNVDRLLNDTIPTDGFVTGRLEKLNIHERNEFVIYPPIPGYSITCRFGNDLLDQVREAIKRTVTVAGIMHYAPDSPYPRLVIARSMEIHPGDDRLPTLCELRGAGAGCTGDMTAVEFVRSLRDE